MYNLNNRFFQPWTLSYLKNLLFPGEVPDQEGPIHVYFAFADHYEPFGEGKSEDEAIAVVKRWKQEYPEISKKFTDSENRHPKHTCFYPAEEYRESILDDLKDLTEQGYADVEVHLHHDNDTPENLHNGLMEFKEKLFHRHGLLRRDPVSNEIIYAFIHGNWALDNSRGDGRWCGVNNEISILRDTGCYADFTLPSAPSDTQTKQINSIYMATDDPVRPKSHDTGVPLERGREMSGDLLMIQGPLMLNFKSRKMKIFPRIENAEVGNWFRASEERLRLWLDANIHVQGQPNHLFIKVHAHGCNDVYKLLDGELDRLYNVLSSLNDTPGYKLHYVSCYEMYQKIMRLHSE